MGEKCGSESTFDFHKSETPTAQTLKNVPSGEFGTRGKPLARSVAFL